MKVKEVDRTANIAWSPAPQVPVYLAAGTAAQQLDATFSTSSSLEIYNLNLAETGHDLPCVASLPVEQRFHKLVWGANGMQDGKMASGLLVGGSDRGVISMYDAAKLIKGEKSLVFSEDKHTGPVAALDFNPFQSNLLASGASESEIYIWDVNKTTAPMTPGPKSQPMDDVRCISWNRQVQHILASAFSSRCLVWDLRKNDPIIKVSDSTSRMRCKVVAWHPDVATQMALASEDDHTPVIQIWDLRLASSPLKTMEGHTKGVLSLAWCKDDSDLLMSCGKDNRILVWNPNSPQGDIVAELPTSNQWSFDVSWCPRNPAIIASASFDGHVSMYSLMGGQQQVQPTSRLTESFGPGMEALQQPTPKVTMQLKSPPKWLRRPCGASFGFGGKLVSFENVKQTVTNVQGVATTQYKPQVYLSQVVTETDLVERSVKLETSLESGNHAEFCTSKVSSLGEEEEGRIWKFIGASFQPDPATEYLNLLGINLSEVKSKLESLTKPANQQKAEVNGVAADISCLGIDDNVDEFDNIAATAAVKEAEKRPTALDKEGFGLSLDGTSADGQLSLALLTGSMELAVEMCVDQGRWADALILAAQTGGDLLVKTQALYFQRENAGGGAAALVEAVSMDGWERLVRNAELDSWKQVLSAVVVYCDLPRRLQLAGQLAQRLAVGGNQYRTASTLAYIVAADLEHVLDMWIEESTTPQQLQDMVEIVVMLRTSIQAQGLTVSLGSDSKLAGNLARYATLLASQGCLASALVYLGDTSANEQLQELRERLERAIATPPQQIARNRQTSVPGAPGTRSSRPDSRRQSFQPLQQPPVERKISSGYNTGLPNIPFNASSVGSAATPQPPISMGHSQLPPSGGLGGYMEPAAPAPVSMLQPPPLTGGEPNNDAAAKSATTGNPLMRRSRAVDPSIATPQGYGGGPYGGYNQGYTGQGDYGAATGGYGAPVNSSAGFGQQPNMYQSTPSDQFGGATDNFGGPSQPNIFTPDPTSLGGQLGVGDRTRTISQSSTSGPGGAGGVPLPPVGFHHTPDHGGPGHKPAVSSGAGWNDPPPLVSRPKTVQPHVTESNYQTGAITQPLIGGSVPDSTPAAPAPVAAPSWTGFQPAPPVQYEAPAPPVQAASLPIEPALPPMPQEHQPIKDVLDMLVVRCQQAANHPQVRRKLEDVQKKLDILYNKLRREVLSGPTLQGLHQIIQHIRAYDYSSCMQVISGLIAGGSFSELADFMPGIKVLLQVAHQTGVYVEQQ